MKLFFLLFAYSSFLMCQESLVPPLQQLALSQIITQISRDERLKKNIILQLLNEQIGYKSERPLVKSIISAAGKELEIAQRFKEYMEVISYAHDAKVQSEQDVNWKMSNNLIFSASDSCPLYSIDVATGQRRSWNFLNRGTGVYSNCLAINNNAEIAHTEGITNAVGTRYTVLVWSANTLQAISTHSLPVDTIPQTLSLSDCGTFLAIGYANSMGRFIKLVEIKSNKEHVTVKGTGGTFRGDYFEYYTTPNAADLAINVINLKNGNTHTYDHADYECDPYCNRPACLKRKAHLLFTHNILIHHPTEDSVVSYDDNQRMIFPKVLVDQKNNAAGLVCGDSLKIYDLDNSHLIKSFTQFNEAEEEVELIAPRSDVIVIRNKKNSTRCMYSLSNQQLLQEFKAHGNTSLHLNPSNNTLAFYEKGRWILVPTHHYVLDHAHPQEMLKALQLEE